MKILHIVTAFPPAYSYGGPVKSSYELSKELVQRGNQVTVFTTDSFDESQRAEISNPEYIDGIEVFRFRNISNKLAKKNRLSSPIGMLPALIQNMNKFDIVHIHEFRSLENAFASIVANKYEVPYIIQPRGSAPKQVKKSQKDIYDRIVGCWMLENASKIIASSQVESEQIPAVCDMVNHEEIIHVPNGVSPDKFKSLPNPGSHRENYNIPCSSTHILYLGRLHSRKGIDILIQAFNEIVKNRDDVYLSIVGPDSGYRNEAELLVEDLNLDDRVRFTGGLYGKSKFEAFVDADVTVMPSKDEHESFGNVAIESLSCKTPVVLTHMCGVSEYLDSDAVDIVSPNPSELAESIHNNIKRNKGTIKSIEAEDILESFSWASIAERTEQVYNKMV